MGRKKKIKKCPFCDYFSKESDSNLGSLAIYLESIKIIVELGFYRNKSEAIIRALKDFIKKEEEVKK